MSVTVTCTAPNARATWPARSPIGPAPVTSTRSPAVTPALRQAQTPTETGSAMAACSASMPSGAGNAKSASRVTRRAIAPSIGGVAKKVTSGHRL